MAFPDLRPAAREFTPGDWPSKRFNSQSGSEIRVLYGSRRINAKLSLTFENITDANAQAFLVDYTAQYGTFKTFTLPASVFAGWTADRTSINAPVGTAWRYDSEPKVQSVFPGRSTVQVTLVAVA